MRINLNVKEDMYNDLLIIASSQNCTISKVIRMMLESEPCATVIHNGSILIQAEKIRREEEAKNNEAKRVHGVQNKWD